jgi:hypothetical protein
MREILTETEWKTWVKETWEQCEKDALAMTDKTLIDCLYEDLISLDEQAGCFDEFTNARIDEQRRKIMESILELEQSAQN